MLTDIGGWVDLLFGFGVGVALYFVCLLRDMFVGYWFNVVVWLAFACGLLLVVGFGVSGCTW